MNLPESIQSQKAMTLIELLVVIGVIILIFSIGFGGYLSMRRLQVVEQASQNLKSDLRNEQRSATLYNRSPGENWVWGKVIRFKNFNSDGSEPLSVEIYRYCASSSRGKNYISYPSGGSNILPVAVTRSTCTTDQDSLVLQNEVSLVAGIDYSVSRLANSIPVEYVVFESVNGKAHFYDATGLALTAAEDFEIVLGSSAPSRRLIKIYTADSRIDIETVGASFK